MKILNVLGYLVVESGKISEFPDLCLGLGGHGNL